MVFGTRFGGSGNSVYYGVGSRCSQDATYANAQRSHFQTAIWSTAGDDQKRRWRESPLLECLPQLVDSLSIYRPEEAAAPSRKSSRARQPPEVGEAEEAEASGPPPMVTRVELGRIEIYRTRWMMAALTKEKEDAQAEVNKARKKLLAIDRALGQDEGTANGTRHKRLEKQLKALAGTELWRITGVGPVVLRGMQRSSGVSSLLAKSGLADRRTVQTVKEIATTCNKLCQSTSEACSGNLTVNEIKSQLLVELSSQWGRVRYSKRYKAQKTGEAVESTCWHRALAYHRGGTSSLERYAAKQWCQLTTGKEWPGRQEDCADRQGDSHHL